MSKSIDNTSELDSYGVWVKNSTEENATSQEIKPELSIDNSSQDLQDINSEDFSDMFKESSDFSIDESENPLTAEENSLSDFDIGSFETEITQENPLTQEQDIVPEAFGDFMTDSQSNEDININDSEEIDLDDFLPEGFSDESVAQGTDFSAMNKKESSEAEESLTIPSETEEIDLGDFMDLADMSQSPVSSEEAGADKGEVDLDAKPLDVQISFSADAVQLQADESDIIETEITDNDEEEVEYSEEETQEVSFDTFSAPEPEEYTKDTSQFDSEEIDLSAFGIDTDAEETPINQNVEEAKAKDKVIDYDLSVGDENAASAPVVNEIKTNSQIEDVPEYVEEISEPKETQNTAIPTSLLEQIVAELSGLRNEINSIKSNIAQMKAEEEMAISNEPSEKIPDTTEDSSTEDFSIEENKDEGGFFGTDDSDDTIALSLDELDNIMSSANLNDDSIITQGNPLLDNMQESEANNISVETYDFESQQIPPKENEDSFIDETTSDDTVETTEDFSADISMENTQTEIPTEENTIEEASSTLNSDNIEVQDEIEPDFEENSVDLPDYSEIENEVSTDAQDSTNAEDDGFMSEFANTEELSNDVPGEYNFVSFSDEEESSNFEAAEEQDLSTSEELSFDFQEDKLEEPNLDDIDLNSEENQENLPDEISVPKENNDSLESMIVESTNNDFMDSVKDNTMDETPCPKEASEDDFFTVENALSSSENQSEEANNNEETLNVTEENQAFDIFSNQEESTENDSTEEKSSLDNIQESENSAFDIFTDDEPSTENHISDSNQATSFFSVDDVLDNTEASSSLEVEDMTDTSSEPVKDSVPNFENYTDNSEEFTSESEEPAMSEDTFATEDFSEQNQDLSFGESTKEEPVVLPESPIINSAPAAKTTEAGPINTDLKQDIKSVLLYMDQLLENLPEEKIIEFAKSDEFATYKKLFNELGLA